MRPSSDCLLRANRSVPYASPPTVNAGQIESLFMPSNLGSADVDVFSLSNRDGPFRPRTCRGMSTEELLGPMFAVKSPFIQTSKFKQEGENNWTRKRDFSRLPTSSASRRRSLGPPTPEDSSILSVHRSRSSSRTKAASPSPSLGRSRSYSVTRPMIASPGPVDWSHQNNLSPRRRYRARAALPSPLPSPSPSPSPLPSPLPSPPPTPPPSPPHCQRYHRHRHRRYRSHRHRRHCCVRCRHRRYRRRRRHSLRVDVQVCTSVPIRVSMIPNQQP